MKNLCNVLLVALAALAAFATLAGCDGGRSDAWDRSRVLLGPVPFKDRLAWIDGARDRVVLVEVGAQPRVRTLPIGRRALWAMPVRAGGHERLAVITRGEEARARGQADEPPGLYLVDVEAPEAPAIRYEIGSPFDRLAIAEDGSVAVAYFSAAGPDADGLFRNPNELAIVKLAAPPSADAAAPNPLLRTVRSFGAAPLGVTLSPPMVVPGAPDATPRTFAFVLAPSSVTVLDATYPERREVTVRLSLDSSAATVTPREVVFAPAACAAYLRADGARDVLQILLAFEAPAAGVANDNDYQPALAELGAGGAPADVAVYDDAAGVRRVLVATPGTQELTVIEARTGQFVSVNVGDPIDRVLLLPANDPANPPRVAVLASVGARGERVHIVDLAGIGDDLVPPEVHTLGLEAPVFDVVAVPNRELVMVVHDSARTVLGLLDVATATVAPLEGAGRLDSFDFSAGGEYLVGATRGIARVGTVDLRNLHPEDVRLDDLPAQVFALASGAIVVDHGDPYGRVTLLPRAGARRDEAIVLSGFLLDGILDEEL
jgi:hypothetical protein